MNEKTDISNAEELDLYLSFTWPEYIEESLRRLIVLSLLMVATPERTADCNQAYSRFRIQVASFPGTPPQVLAYLATLTDERLLARVAESPLADVATLAYLALSKHTGVRVAVAENCAATLDILALLATDQCPDVRYSLAENRALPLAILEILCEDENPYVAARAIHTARGHAAVSLFRHQDQVADDMLRARSILKLLVLSKTCTAHQQHAI